MVHRQGLGTWLVVLAVLAVAGCGGDEPPGGGPSGATPPEEEPTSASSGPSPEDTVAPAAGRLLSNPSTSMRGPEGWKVDSSGGAPPLIYAQRAVAPGVYGDITLFETQNASAMTSKEMAENGLVGFSRGSKPELSFDAELGSQAAYRATGVVNDQVVVEYGAVRDGVMAQVVFGFYEKLSTRAERQQIIESTLATFTWK